MFTRCPGCHTVHPLNAVLLAQGNGLYRCGKCNKVSNALQNLFDQWPGAGDKPTTPEAGNRQPPVLGLPSEPGNGQPAEAPTEISDEEAALLKAAGFGAQAEPTSSAPANGQRAWMAAAAAMGVVTLLNLFFVSGDALLASPSIHGALEKVGLADPAPAPLYRNLELLRLASSEMHSHPTLDEALILNATVVNRADREQPFPALQITLFDAQNQPLAARVFGPEEYLPSTSDLDSGMPPGAYLPVIMELMDPGQHAVGFEMKFH